MPAVTSTPDQGCFNNHPFEIIVNPTTRPPLYDCKQLHIDRAGETEHNFAHVLGASTLSLLPVTSFPYRLFT